MGNKWGADKCWRWWTKLWTLKTVEQLEFPVILKVGELFVWLKVGIFVDSERKCENLMFERKVFSFMKVLKPLRVFMTAFEIFCNP